MTKPIGIIVGVFLMKTLVSCCGDCCGDLGDVQDFRVNDLSSANLVLNSDGGLDTLEVSTPVDYTSLRIALTLDLIEENKFVAYSGGFSSTLACSPVEPYILDQIIEFTIIADQDYYSYEAGQSLNDIFKFGYNLNADSYRTTDEFRFDSYYSTPYFSLIIPPDSLGEYTFTFNITLDDGREFTLITDPITIIS